MAFSAPELDTTTARFGDERRGAVTARVDGVIIGWLHFCDYAGTCVIELIRVDEPHRGRGIASAMLGELRRYLPASRLGRHVLNDDGRVLMRSHTYHELKEPIA